MEGLVGREDIRIGGGVATILVLGRRGYETAVRGKNGFVCMVERSWMEAFDSPSKSYANCPNHPSLGQKRFNPAPNLLNSHLSQLSLRNRWPVTPVTEGLDID
jgi:hypothetical protein